jgi:phytanoyl-CoA hydroxylase
MKIMRDIMVVKGAVTPASPLHAVNKMISFEDDAELYGFALEPRLLAAVRSLVGDDLFSVTTNVFNKPPDIDGRHPLHQDLRYFRVRPADQIVGVWTAISPATRESGCLAVLPGSHKGELMNHAEPDWEYVNHAFFGIEGVDREARQHVEMRSGDTLLFHPLLVHGSGQNRSAGFRRAISAHYAAAQCSSPEHDWKQGKQARRIP